MLLPVFAMLYRDIGGRIVPISRVLGCVEMDRGEAVSFTSEDGDDMERAHLIEISNRQYHVAGKDKEAERGLSETGQVFSRTVSVEFTRTLRLTPRQ